MARRRHDYRLEIFVDGTCEPAGGKNTGPPGRSGLDYRYSAAATSGPAQSRRGGRANRSDHGAHRQSRRKLLKNGRCRRRAHPRRDPASRRPAAPRSTKVLDSRPARTSRSEQEGEVVYYSHDGEAGIAALLDGYGRTSQDQDQLRARPRPGRSTPRSPRSLGDASAVGRPASSPTYPPPSTSKTKGG